MKPYTHTQPGTVITRSLLGLAFLFLGLSVVGARPLLVGVPIPLLICWLFHSLTIEINHGELRWRFGPGLIRKRVALADIAAARIVRTNFFEGWGIHLSRFGWLYNVSGFAAVAVTLKNGQRFALGTDEPENLERALNREISAV